jgi:hypothetical protein
MKRFLFSFAILGRILGISSFTLIGALHPEMYLSKGNDLSFMITSENGAVSYSVITIETITRNNGLQKIYATNNAQNDQHKNTLSYRMTYYCDSVNWSVDALNHLNIPLVYSSNFIVSLRGDSLIYPFNMKVGDTLRQASGSELIYGSGNNERYVIINSRKVAANENIAVGGEILSAFRIESAMIKGSVTDYGALGKIPTKAEYKFREWFVPSKGVVKSELTSGTGTTTMLFQSVK